MALIGEFEVAARRVTNAEPDQFRFCGETFTVADKVGIIPLGRFAKAAMSGLDSAEMEGLAAMIDLLADSVIDEDRERFLDTAARNRADAEDLMPIVQAVIQAKTGRPTEPPSDSSVGRSRIGESSTGSHPLGDIPPIQRDPRVRELQPLGELALSMAG